MGPKEEIQLLDAWQGLPVGTRVTYTPVIGRPELGTVEAETVEEPRMFHGQPMVRISGKGLVHLLAVRRSTTQTAATGRA